MATQTVYIASSDSGNIDSPNNAIGAPNGTWAGVVNSATSWTHRWNFTNPTNPTLTGNQSFTLRVRKGSNSNSPTITSVTILRSGTSVYSDTTSRSVTSTTGQDIVITWPSASGSSAGLQIEIVLAGAGGSPSARNSAQIDAVTYLSQTVDVGPNEGTASGTWSFSGVATSPITPLSGYQFHGFQVSRNNTNVTGFTFPSNIPVGSYAVLVTYGAVQFLAPEGWQQVRSAVNYGGAYIFTRTVLGSEGFVACTHNGDNYPTYYALYLFPAGSAVIAHNGQTNASLIPGHAGPSASFTPQPGYVYMGGAMSGRVAPYTNSVGSVIYGTGITKHVDYTVPYGGEISG